MAIGVCFGYNCGYAINPARDFAPRLFSGITNKFWATQYLQIYLFVAISGWGLDVFTYSYHWWVVPILATHAGAIIGAWIYYLAIGKLTKFNKVGDGGRWCMVSF